MDFEDSGIESDPKVNSDNDTLNQNEPIISFSPERCRFDSGQSSSRKSSTTFPISVTDLQLDDSGLEQLANANHNSITLQNSATAVPKNASSIHHHNSILTQHHHPHPHHPPLLANVHKPAYSFLPQTQLHSTSASIPTFSSTSALTSSSSGPVISTHSTATLSSGATTKNSSISLVSSSSSGGFSTEGNSAPLMVNGAISSTTSDLQKRLEKRIAQATSTTSTTSSSPTRISTPPLPNLATDSDSKLTKHSNDSLRSDQAANGNQISFSPDKAYITSASTSSTLNFLDSGSEVDLWEREIVTDGKTKIISDHDVMLSNLEGEKEASQISIIDELMMNSDKSSAVAVTTSSSAWGGENTTASKIAGMEDSGGKLVLTTTPSCPSVKTSDTHTTTTSGGGGGSSSGTNVSETGGDTANSNNIPKHKSLRNNTTPPSGPPPVTNSTLPTASVITVNSGFDMRKVSALLPPQRLAIPSKPNPQLQSSSSHKGKFPSTSLTNTPSGGTFSTSSPFANGGSSGSTSTAPTTTTTSSSSLNLSSSAAVHKMSRNASISETSCNNAVSTCPPLASGNGNVRVGSNSSKLSSEKKPLVQWDSDESEEELSFFPPSKRGVITDNLSIDNMSLSGEEEDLHLTPPRPLAKRCPCDPRCWLERHELHSSHHHHHHHHGDVTHTVSSRPCVIS